MCIRDSRYSAYRAGSILTILPNSPVPRGTYTCHQVFISTPQRYADKRLSLIHISDLKNKFEQVEAELKDDTQTNLETYRTQVVETINNDIVMRLSLIHI